MENVTKKEEGCEWGTWQPVLSLLLLLWWQQGKEAVCWLGKSWLDDLLARWLSDANLSQLSNLSLLVSREEWVLWFPQTLGTAFYAGKSVTVLSPVQSKSSQMLVDWLNDDCKHNAALIINIKINSRLSANTGFGVPVSSLLYGVSRAVLMAEKLECVRICSWACPALTWSVSPLILWLPWTHFKMYSPLKETGPVFCKLLCALPGPCRLSISCLMSCSWLTDTKNSCDFQGEKICNCWNLLSLTLYYLLSVALDNRLCYLYFTVK